jgi:hypothetical protein
MADTRPGTPATVAALSTNVRVGAGVVAARLFIWMLVTSWYHRRRATTGFGSQGSLTVSGDSLAAAYFGDEHYDDSLANHDNDESGYSTDSGTVPDGTAADPFGPDEQIDAQRDLTLTGRAGLIGLLAAPTPVLAVLSLLGRRAGYELLAPRGGGERSAAPLEQPGSPVTGPGRVTD